MFERTITKMWHPAHCLSNLNLEATEISIYDLIHKLTFSGNKRIHEPLITRTKMRRRDTFLIMALLWNNCCYFGTKECVDGESVPEVVALWCELLHRKRFHPQFQDDKACLLTTFINASLHKHVTARCKFRPVSNIKVTLSLIWLFTLRLHYWKTDLYLI